MIILIKNEIKREQCNSCNATQNEKLYDVKMDNFCITLCLNCLIELKRNIEVIEHG